MTNYDIFERDKEKEKLKKQQEDDLVLKKIRNKADLEKIIAIPEGRRFLWRLIKEECKTFSCSYDKEHAVMAFNEGKRMIGASLVLEIREIKPTIIEQMINEEQSEVKKKVKK